MQLLTWHLLIPYGLFVLLFVTFSGIDIMHMVKFGTYTLANYLALVAFLAGTAYILWGTAQLLASVEWLQPLTGALRVDEILGTVPDL